VFGAQYRERTDKAVATLVAGSQAVAMNDLPAPQRQLAATRFIRHPRWRAQVLVAAARDEPPAASAEILRAALGISLTVGDEAALASAIRSIAAAVARSVGLATALTYTDGLRDPETRARALFAIADAVDASDRPEAVQAAFRAVQQVGDIVAYEQLVRDHAAQLSGLVSDAELTRISAPESHVTLASESHPTWHAEALAAAGDLAAALHLADAGAAPETRIVVLRRWWWPVTPPGVQEHIRGVQR
jgi:hypothetical protein